VFRQHPPAPWVDLHLPGYGHPGALQAEVEAADAGEQRQDVHHAAPRLKSTVRSAVVR
jgi:hypothetical protein